MLLFARRRQDWCGDVLFALYTQLLLITIIFIYACLQQKRKHIKYNSVAFCFVNMLAVAIDEERVALLDLVWHI